VADRIVLTSPELAKGPPSLREPVVDGLFRRGEVVNWIASPKVGKTWMLYGLLIAVATGTPWLGRKVAKGRVLLIDNELHPETGIQRLYKVATALGADLRAVDAALDIAWLRGASWSLEEVEEVVRSKPRGTWTLTALDAFYRFIPKGTDENANGDMVQLYNHLDRIAAASGSSVLNVHHASKGDQSQKGTTDVGSGAGAISRATDTHIVYLRHATEGCVTMRAVCRSFPPPKPAVLRVSPPVVTLEPEMDPEDLWTPKKAQAAAKRDWTVEEFVAAFVDGTASKGEVLERAMSHTIPKARARELLASAADLDLVESVVVKDGSKGRPRELLKRV
jgi:hypothetical protein